MSSNETPLGTSNKALEIIKNSSGNLARYPDGSSQELRKAIANFHNIDIDNIICGFFIARHIDKNSHLHSLFIKKKIQLDEFIY